MFDVAEIRTMELHSHPPAIIYLLLFALSLLCAVLAGFRMAHRAQRDWLHILAFAVFTTLVINTMLDVEYPRVGLIRLTDADQALVELRDSMR
jgi:tellurite resistance protein TehA-like permease